MTTAASDVDSDPKGHYRTLGVSPAATDDEIRRAYRRAAKRWHPDRNGSAEARRRMAEINEAWAMLGDPGKRAAYDRSASSDGPASGPDPSASPAGPRPVVAPWQRPTWSS